MKTYTFVENYKNIPIMISPEGNYHVSKTYHDYKSIDEAKQEIKEILKRTKRRQPLLAYLTMVLGSVWKSMVDVIISNVLRKIYLRIEST